MAPKQSLALPLLVVSPSDVVRLKRELEALGDYLHQASLRAAGSATPKLPRTSRLLDEFAHSNQLNLLQVTDRKEASAFLQKLAETAPVLHMSFAADPSSAFTEKILLWLRQNIDGNVLLRIGLQPTIAAGCVLRTPSKLYDFSLRGHFAQQRPLLISKLRSAGGKHE